MKKQVKSPQPTPVLAAHKPAQNSTNHDSPTIVAAGISTSVSEKIAQAAAKGEYIDFAGLLSTLSAFAPTSVAFASANVLPTQGDNSVTCVIKSPRKRHIDSFDTWLHAWNVYEKLVMAAQPARYTELASYREQIQFANRKFRWSSVYLFDIHSRMARASKCLHDSSARLDIIDTTLYATVPDTSALRPHPRQCSRCKSFDHMVKDCQCISRVRPVGGDFDTDAKNARK